MMMLFVRVVVLVLVLVLVMILFLLLYIIIIFLTNSFLKHLPLSLISSLLICYDVTRLGSVTFSGTGYIQYLTVGVPTCCDKKTDDAVVRFIRQF